MKNITISIDEETHRLACLRAEEMDTSVPDLVRQYLTDFAAAAKESERERRRRRMREVIDHIAVTRPGFSASDNLSREELYDRVAARSAAEEARRQHPRSA